MPPTLPAAHPPPPAVLKNLTNIFTLAGDYALYGRSYNLNVWGCVALMLLSAVCGAATDLAFDARGYFWQIVNCMFTAAYSLYMRGAMDRVAQHTSDGKKLGEFSMVGAGACGWVGLLVGRCWRVGGVAGVGVGVLVGGCWCWWVAHRCCAITASPRKLGGACITTPAAGGLPVCLLRRARLTLCLPLPACLLACLPVPAGLLQQPAQPAPHRPDDGGDG